MAFPEICEAIQHLQDDIRRKLNIKVDSHIDDDHRMHGCVEVYI